MGYLLRKRGQNGTICFVVYIFLVFYLVMSKVFINFAADFVDERRKVDNRTPNG